LVEHFNVSFGGRQLSLQQVGYPQLTSPHSLEIEEEKSNQVLKASFEGPWRTAPQ
jgi:hypothetical protein